MNYPATLTIQPWGSKALHAEVTVPGSKSITNRAMILGALHSTSRECRLHGVLQSEDTEVMIHALRQLGIGLDLDWKESTVRFPQHREGLSFPASELHVANSGTSMRFLAALASLGTEPIRLDGIARMRERPIEDLLGALRFLGIRAESESGNGCPPARIQGNGLHGWQQDRVQIRGDISSQFLSALLMVAPHGTANGVTIALEGPLVSVPYVEMTLRMMQSFGVTVKASQSSFQVLPFVAQNAEPLDYRIEPDASAASYFFACAAILGGKVTVRGLTRQSLQGDIGFVDLLESMGCLIEYGESSITVQGRALHGIDVDMNAVSDTAMTLGVVACFAEGPTTIRNVGHIRHKETDRIAALTAELRKVGATVTDFADGLTITPGRLHAAEIDTYNDHRMAMSMALIGLKVPGVVIRNPGCVAKTYPGFWHDLAVLGA